MGDPNDEEEEEEEEAGEEEDRGLLLNAELADMALMSASGVGGDDMYRELEVLVICRENDRLPEGWY